MVDDGEDKAKSLLDINPEGNMLREIKDILDELHIMTNIKSKQQRVFKQFLKHIKHMIAPSLALSKEVGTARPKKVQASYSDAETSDDTSDAEVSEKQAKHETADGNAKWTLESGLDFFNGLNDRLSDLSNLRESAENTERAVSYPSVGVSFSANLPVGCTSGTKTAASERGTGSQSCSTNGRDFASRSRNHAVYRHYDNFCRL